MKHGGHRQPVVVAQLGPVAQLDAGLGQLGSQSLEGVALAHEEALAPQPHLLPAAGNRRHPEVRPGQLEELVEEPAHVGQHPNPLREGGLVVVRERESTPGAVEAAGVLIEVARLPAGLCHGPSCCNR